MNRTEYYPILKAKYPDIETFAEIERTFRKIEEHFGAHERIQISVSGGSDSDCIVHLICTYFPEYLHKCFFVFSNTGLEYEATKRHLQDLENKYGIHIDRIRGKSVVYVVKKYGVPILSKFKSHFLRLYINGAPSGEKIVMYDGIKTFHAMQFTENQKRLAKYLKENNIKISEKCCDLSKKKPLKQYAKQNNIDMSVTGERREEGGQRSIAHKSCFEQQKEIDKYMPLWWWSNETKAQFKAAEGIRFSDCYEVYGLRRTGCVGCPFNLNIANDLQVMYRFEPKLFKACMSVFGESYRLMDEFKCRRKKCLPECYQMTLF